MTLVRVMLLRYTYVRSYEHEKSADEGNFYASKLAKLIGHVSCTAASNTENTVAFPNSIVTNAWLGLRWSTILFAIFYKREDTIFQIKYYFGSEHVMRTHQ